MEKPRTLSQNKALHLWYQHLAGQLNDAGYTVQKVLKPGFEIAWTPELIKELIWRPIQETSYGKHSTSELSSGELQTIYDVINVNMGEKFGIHVPFPSLESLVEEDRRTRTWDYPEFDDEPDFDTK